MKKYIILIIFLLVIQTTIAATIHGISYDTSLLPIDKAVIEINTEPKQTIVTQNGQYSFNVPIGEYTITATATVDNEFLTENQNISVKDNGDYTLDLILFPEIDDFDDPLDFEIEPGLEEEKSLIWLWIVIIIIVGIIAWFLLKNKKQLTKKPKEQKTEEEIKDEDEELDKIYKIIKEAKRITQKEIRKQTSLSESKISLIISQLESENKIKKIKKGRTNIIIAK